MNQLEMLKGFGIICLGVTLLTNVFFILPSSLSPLCVSCPRPQEWPISLFTGQLRTSTATTEYRRWFARCKYTPVQVHIHAVFTPQSQVALLTTFAQTKRALGSRAFGEYRTEASRRSTKRASDWGDDSISTYDIV